MIYGIRTRNREKKGKFILINSIMFQKFKYKNYRFIIIEYLVQRHRFACIHISSIFIILILWICKESSIWIHYTLSNLFKQLLELKLPRQITDMFSSVNWQWSSITWHAYKWEQHMEFHEMFFLNYNICIVAVMERITNKFWCVVKVISLLWTQL